jgi:peptide deformylase
MKIYTYPSPILTKKTKKVTDFGKDFQSLVDIMLAKMRFSLGVGLAAPQVGESIKLFVAEYETKLYVIANPKIEWRSFDMETDIEACLSLPGQKRYIERSKAIGISGKDRYGKDIKMDVEGYLARIFQHEIDHLNGILIA